MTAPTPEQMRELAGVLDRCADNDRNAVRVPLLYESAATLRAAADQLEAVQIEAGEWREAVPVGVLLAILTADTAPGA